MKVGWRDEATKLSDVEAGLLLQGLSSDMSFPGPEPNFFEQLHALGVELERGELERLGAFLERMLETNKTTNLTAITEPQEAWRKHILDAMTLMPVLASIGEQLTAKEGEARKELSVADVGSGGGVPALPLAIVLPDAKFTLIEATGKKAKFLMESAEALGLKNVRVLNERAETVTAWGTPGGREHREQFDVAMARALGHLAVVCELCGPLVKPGGMVIAVKGAKAEQELEESRKALGLLGLVHVQTMDTPTGKLVLLEKTTRTPKTYPRRVGEPSRVPLGVERSSDG